MVLSTGLLQAEEVHDMGSWHILRAGLSTLEITEEAEAFFLCNPLTLVSTDPERRTVLTSQAFIWQGAYVGWEHSLWDYGGQS